ncbi:hypothetical protein TWF225_003976 [Orbilia oligospora]|nr:hypothetical protein TWF225_003976 [Orbilia oligospora]
MCKLNLLLAFPVNSDLAFWPSRKGNTTHAHSRSCKFDNEGSEAPVKQNGYVSEIQSVGFLPLHTVDEPLHRKQELVGYEEVCGSDGQSRVSVTRPVLVLSDSYRILVLTMEQSEREGKTKSELRTRPASSAQRNLKLRNNVVPYVGFNRFD